jgi:hypothetical protein
LAETWAILCSAFIPPNRRRAETAATAAPPPDPGFRSGVRVMVLLALVLWLLLVGCAVQAWRLAR